MCIGHAFDDSVHHLRTCVDLTCKEYGFDNNINTPEENVLIMTARTWTYYVHGDSMHLMRKCIPRQYAL